MAEFTSLNGFTVKDATARNIAKGRNQAVAYSDYATMIEALNAMENDEFKTGQNIYIGTVGVPDLWVYSIEPIRHNFTYVSDEDAVEMLKNNVTIQVGFYRLAMLEGQKVDLTTVNAQLAEHENAITEHDTKLSAHDTKFTEVENSISEQNKNLANVNVYVGNDGKLHFVDSEGADSVLPFSGKNFSLIATGRMDGDNVSSTYQFAKAYDDVFCILNASDDRRSLVNVALASSNSSLSKSQVYTFDEWEQSRCIKTIYGTLKKVKVGDTITFTGKWTCAYMIFSL